MGRKTNGLKSRRSKNKILILFKQHKNIHSLQAGSVFLGILPFGNLLHQFEKLNFSKGKHYHFPKLSVILGPMEIRFILNFIGLYFLFKSNQKMLLSPILDTGISFIFFYFTLSTLASTLNEWWLQYRQTRGKLLRWSIEEIMNDHLNKNFADILYNHPLVDLLKKKQTSYPPYIPNEVFTKVLIDIIGDEYEKNEGKFEQKGNGDIVYEKGEVLEDKLLRFKAGLETLQYSDFKKWLETFCKDARTQEELEENISTWFSYYMEQVRGWFKIRIQKGLFLLGLIISIFLNVNSIHIAKSFWQNHQLRGEVTSIATNWYEENKISSMPEESDMQTVYQDLKSLQELPIGWNLNKIINWNGAQEQSPETAKSNLFFQGLLAILGWLLSALFISFGAPLWFEILGKVMSVKSSAQKDK